MMTPKGPVTHRQSDGPPARRRRLMSAVLWFAEGALVAVIAISVTFARREDDMVNAVRTANTRAVSVLSEDAPFPEDRAVEIMHSVHDVLWGRLQTLASTKVGSGWWFRSTYSHLMAPTGHCGSFTHVLARALQLDGFDVRIGQMLVDGVWGGHIIVLVQLGGKLVPLDAYYDIAFRGADGRLLSFREVQQDWDHVRKQCPPNYNPAYRYEDIRYTNWRGLPVDLLGSFFGEMSLRAHLLNLYWVTATGLGVVLGVLVLAHVIWAVKDRRAAGRA